MVSVRADQSIVLYRVLNIYTFNNNIKKRLIRGIIVGTPMVFFAILVVLLTVVVINTILIDKLASYVES